MSTITLEPSRHNIASTTRGLSLADLEARLAPAPGTRQKVTSTWTRLPDGSVRVHLATWGRWEVAAVGGFTSTSTGAAWQELHDRQVIGEGTALDRGAFLAWLLLGRVDLPSRR